MRRRLKASEINHLRRLLGWVRCECGPTPDELMKLCNQIAPAIEAPLTIDAKQRFFDARLKAESIPQYVRAALKALQKVVDEDMGNVIDADTRPKLLGRQSLESKP